jgi:hypothetical protein
MWMIIIYSSENDNNIFDLKRLEIIIEQCSDWEVFGSWEYGLVALKYYTMIQTYIFEVFKWSDSNGILYELHHFDDKSEL